MTTAAKKRTKVPPAQVDAELKAYVEARGGYRPGIIGQAHWHLNLNGNAVWASAKRLGYWGSPPEVES